MVRVPTNSMLPKLARSPTPLLPPTADQIVFSTGAQTDRHLGIPGEEFAGSHSATDFVAWYNGHPDYIDYEFDLSQKRVAIIGLGNVAVDVARILCKTVDECAAPIWRTTRSRRSQRSIGRSYSEPIYSEEQSGGATPKVGPPPRRASRATSTTHIRSMT